MTSSQIPTSDPREGRVRWRRAAAMFASAVVACAVLMAMTAQGILAANFSISGFPFVVTADRLDGQGFEQFASIDNMAPGSPLASNVQGNFPNQGDTGGQVLVFVSAIGSAQLTNLCQSIAVVPGQLYLKLTAGADGTKVSATNLVVDSDALAGNATFNNIEIGRDASTLDRVPSATRSDQAGSFGQQAESVHIDNLRQDNWATTAAQFTLPGLNLRFAPTPCSVGS